MPLCVICGNPLMCSHVKEHVSSNPLEKPCSLKKGAIWVHVMDDLGSSVNEIEVDVAGTKKPTEAGFARFDPLEAQKYTAKLSPLSSDQAKAYDPPDDDTRGVWLDQGEIAYLSFALARKAKLAVKVVRASDKTTHVEGATVTVTGKGDPGDRHTDQGIADYGVRSAGPYSIKVVLDDEKAFYPPDAALDITLAPGEDRTEPIEVSPLARPKVKVVWSGGDIEDVAVKLHKDAEHDLGKTAVTGLAELAVAAAGLRGGEHEVRLTFDDKIYMPSWSTPSLTWTIAEGSTETKTVTLIKLARPKIEVEWGTTKIEDVGVKLKKDAVEHDLGKSAKTTGLTELAGGTKGVEPNAEHEVLLDFDENVYMRVGGVAPKVTFDEDFTGTKTVKLIKLALPTIKVVDKVTGNPVEGVDVKLTATDDHKEYDHGKTGKAGGAIITRGNPRLPPGTYEITVSKSGLTQDPTPDATFAEGSVETVIVKVTTLKAVLRVRVDRYDGKALPKRVKFELATQGDPLTILKTVTTDPREVEVDKVEGPTTRKVKVRDDWKEVELDPEAYVLTIPDLENAVLKEQVPTEVWAIGPSNKGKVEAKVTLVAGETVEVAFTLSRYKRVQFIGFNVKPGYKQGHRCPTCFKQYDAAGTCTVVSCASAALKSKRCFKCGAMYDSVATECATCGYELAYCCDTCFAYRSAPGKCSGCPAIVKHRCHRCGTLSTTLGPCPTSACTGMLSPWCKVCNALKVANPDGECPSCATLIVDYWCVTCSKETKVPGRCGVCKGLIYDEQIYLGLPDNNQDLLARCLAMKSAIKTASGKESTDADVLKVFMGPEFYFRGHHGAYPVADLSLIQEQMRKETQDTKYKDWLFVFGTAIGYLAQGSTAGVEYKLKAVADVVGATKIKLTHENSRVGVLDKIPMENERLAAGQWKAHIGAPVVVKTVTKISADEYEIEVASAVSVAKDAEVRVLEPVASEIFNVALVQKGGSDDGIAGLREGLIYKESISSIDFLRNAGLSFGKPEERRIYVRDQDNLALPTEGGGGSLARAKNPTTAEATKSGLGGGSVFTVDGVTFGVEVCLDHLDRKLNTYSAALPAGASKVQVHLIPSWGMSIKPDSLAGMVGTPIFNVDGPDGCDAAKVTKLSPAGTWARLAAPAMYLVPDGAKEDVKYMRIDPANPEKPAQETEIKDLEGKLADLVIKHDHKANGVVSGGNDYAWVDLYAPEDIPPAETA